MAQITHGADVAQLRDLASSFDRQADGLSSSTTTVSNAVQASVWLGPVAVEFKTTWTQVHSVNLRAAADLLRTQAKALRDQAQQQEQASAGGSALVPAETLNAPNTAVSAVGVVGLIASIGGAIQVLINQILSIDWSEVKLASELKAVTVSDAPLTQAQMQANAQYILDYLRSLGWSKEAVCAMLGNMQAESTINPGRWQVPSRAGYGLVQWTPPSGYLDWAAANGYGEADMNGQLQLINYEFGNHIQFYPSAYSSMTGSDFKTSTVSPDQLSTVFLHNYERPAVQDSQVEQQRASFAMDWYNTLQ